MNGILPIYRHPTQVVLVDDSASFIRQLEFHMGEIFLLKSFQNALDALEWLDAAINKDGEESRIFQLDYAEAALLPEGRMSAMYIDRVYGAIMDSDRFHCPAVVVVDYAMPQMTGIEFCRKLKGSPCKKILLTGEADETIAVSAFNEGLIDRYLKKSASQVLSRLETDISELTKKYFDERSNTLKALFVRDSFSFLSDDVLAQLIDRLVVEHDFVEQFVFPNPAGMLFLDRNGASKLMVVETGAGLAAHLEAAQDYGAPAALLAALKQKQVVPLFWESGGMYTERSVDWEKYCLPAHICRGRETYYWALFDFPQRYLPNPIFSYNDFLQSRAHEPAPG